MTSPDRTDELIREMLARRAPAGTPRRTSSVARCSRWRQRLVPRAPTTCRRRLAIRQRRRLLLAATLVVAIPGLIVALLGGGAAVRHLPRSDDPGTAAGFTARPIDHAGRGRPRCPGSSRDTAAIQRRVTGPTPPWRSGRSPWSRSRATTCGSARRPRRPAARGCSSRSCPAGTRMLIVDGPVAADGYDWYEVQTDGELIDLFGWVATGKDGEVWLAPKRPRCPENADAATVATLNRIDFLACFGDTQVQVRARPRTSGTRASRRRTAAGSGVPATCDVDTRWLLFPSASVTLVTDKGNEHQIDLAMPPDLASRLQDVPHQATLLLTVSMDAPEAASCDVHDPVTGSELIPAHRAVTACRLQFVVQQIAWRDAARSGHRVAVPREPLTGPPMARGASAITPAPQPTRGAAGEEPRLPCLVAPSGDGRRSVQPFDRPAPGSMQERECETEARRVDLEERARPGDGRISADLVADRDEAGDLEAVLAPRDLTRDAVDPVGANLDGDGCDANHRHGGDLLHSAGRRQPGALRIRTLVRFLAER